MVHESTNLTLPRVVQAIEDVLDDYPEYPYHFVFAIHEFQQKLIAHILSQLPHLYGVEGDSASQSKPKNPHNSPIAERLRLEVLVRGSILHILRENASRLGDQLPRKQNADRSLKPVFG
ncbi:hypothetical protein [Neosynechococcus sphagnicola]|uniref:hypothetical protein n=1 Tax=Neosynechococcus sphagnicola TaxID=1501145 RepID=UPI0012E03C6B|nr:hypothetical protein [Neosynechococcus sphagnicola]